MNYKYREYLQSDDWKKKRQERLWFDKKCQICGRPFDLEVHHLTYKNFPCENATDLITLCRRCHEKVEFRKRRYWHKGSDSHYIVRDLIIEQFNKQFEDKDYSAGGDLDLCSLDTIKRYLFPYIREHGLTADYCSGSTGVIDFFRLKRYAVILNMMDRGACPDDVFRRYRFSENMVYKVFRNPEIARRQLSEEKYNAETE